MRVNGGEKVVHGYHNLWENCGKMGITWCHSSLLWTFYHPEKMATKNKKHQIGQSLVVRLKNRYSAR